MDMRLLMHGHYSGFYSEFVDIKDILGDPKSGMAHVHCQIFIHSLIRSLIDVVFFFCPFRVSLVTSSSSSSFLFDFISPFSPYIRLTFLNIPANRLYFTNPASWSTKRGTTHKLPANCSRKLPCIFWYTYYVKFVIDHATEDKNIWEM